MGSRRFRSSCARPGPGGVPAGRQAHSGASCSRWRSQGEEPPAVGAGPGLHPPVCLPAALRPFAAQAGSVAPQQLVLNRQDAHLLPASVLMGGCAGPPPLPSSCHPRRRAENTCAALGLRLSCCGGGAFGLRRQRIWRWQQLDGCLPRLAESWCHPRCVRLRSLGCRGISGRRCGPGQLERLGCSAHLIPGRWRGGGRIVFSPVSSCHHRKQPCRHRELELAWHPPPLAACAARGSGSRGTAGALVSTVSTVAGTPGLAARRRCRACPNLPAGLPPSAPGSPARSAAGGPTSPGPLSHWAGGGDLPPPVSCKGECDSPSAGRPSYAC